MAKIYLFFIVAVLFFSCVRENDQLSFTPTPFEVDLPDNYPPLRIPDDNPFTVEGVAVGRALFYDSIISKNGLYSCSTCHRQSTSFSDTVTFSIDVNGNLLNVNTMPLFNVGFYARNTWNGKMISIEQDVFLTIRTLHGNWEGLLLKLNEHDLYPAMFYKAFGQRPISSEMVEKAMAQFVRSIISFNARFDSIFAGLTTPTPKEIRGYELFFTEEGDCFHCHIDPLFTDLDFHNNALDKIENMSPGYQSVTGSEQDRGKFKVPSLRNLIYTAPYMHDGRFKTLKEVINFYSEGLQQTPFTDSNMKNAHKGGLQLSEEDKDALIAFLLTLTDQSFISDQRFSKP